MPDLPETTPDSHGRDRQQPDAGRSEQAGPECARLMVPVSELTAHPGNVREDLELTAEFCASIATTGCGSRCWSPGQRRRVPGHRRAPAPCCGSEGRAGGGALSHRPRPRRGRGGPVPGHGAGQRRRLPEELPRAEEAAALFAAHEAGASRTRLRKATGRKTEEIKTALKVAQISEGTRSAAGDLTRQLDLEDLALLAEFDGDAGPCQGFWMPCSAGTTWNTRPSGSASSAPRAAEHPQLLGELQAPGVQITTELPAGAARLSQLLHDGEDLTPETHRLPGPGRVLHLLGPAPRRLLLRQSRRARPHLRTAAVGPAPHGR